MFISKYFCALRDKCIYYHDCALPTTRHGQTDSLTELQRQTAVTAYFPSKQLLLFVFTLWTVHQFTNNYVVITSLKYYSVMFLFSRIPFPRNYFWWEAVAMTNTPLIHRSAKPKGSICLLHQ